jgi:hypothetical protein
MNQYLLLLHETPADYAGLSPAEMGALIERYTAWAQSLGASGRLVSGEKLAESGGVHLKLRDGQPFAADGPYVEAKDVIGGFFIIRAEDEAAARRIAEGCPHLHGRNWIEIRQVESTPA